MSGHGDLLEKVLTDPKAAAKPAEYVPPPGWSIAPVQKDAPDTYVPPPGWHAQGTPVVPPTQPGQQNAVSTYVPPPGWSAAPLGAAPTAPPPPPVGNPVAQQVLANQGQALNQSTLAALRARFGG